ncbi:uncharacterized protein LOC129589770 isoform X2 [Paramacrobiotus metropolitanus]|uniref:uncharacterized protein LOC129589770 isoform X2 n=1 Tax=Paramacrobiotus metropolitanus TaxID=2943436 RepID=UPI002446046D|nr:uncharacterized protein LOC129589770 isoform X2 [Paramacrobiotus metropolitanus]
MQWKMLSKKVVFLTTGFALVVLVWFTSTRYTTFSASVLLDLPFQPHLTNRTVDIIQENPLPDITNDLVKPETADYLPVHIVRFYETPPSGDSHSFCWTECISLLSVLLYVRPSAIYIHTNHPDYWPLGRCYMITDYSKFQLIYRRRRLVAHGRSIKPVAHEADMMKYSVVYKYGGIVMDIDVFHLPKMTQWRDGKYECLLTREDRFMNSGFIACHKGHPYIRDILIRYRDDYRDGWLYNSGIVPWEIYNKIPEYNTTLYVDRQMGNHSSSYRGPIRYKEIPAWHSYFHGCKENEENTIQQAVNSTFWEMLHFIAAEGYKAFPYPTTPKTTTAMTRTSRITARPTGTPTVLPKLTDRNTTSLWSTTSLHPMIPFPTTQGRPSAHPSIQITHTVINTAMFTRSSSFEPSMPSGVTEQWTPIRKISGNTTRKADTRN